MNNFKLRAITKKNNVVTFKSRQNVFKIFVIYLFFGCAPSKLVTYAFSIDKAESFLVLFT